MAKKSGGQKPPFNPLGGGPIDPDQLARELLGRHYRMRNTERTTTPSFALDVIQSLQYVLETELERVVRYSVWSESQEGAGRSLCRVLREVLANPREGITPVLWSSDIRIAAEANASAFREHPMDLSLVTTSGGIAAGVELWLDIDPSRLLWVDAMGDASTLTEEQLIAVHDDWWELPEVGRYAPLGFLLLPMSSPVPVRTSRGLPVPAGTPGLCAIALFAPIVEGARERNIPVMLTPEGIPTGPTLILRPLESCWATLPIPPFYAPLVAMRWFLGEPFIESGEEGVPAEKRREVAALMDRQGTPVGLGRVPGVRYVRFRKERGEIAVRDGTGASEARGWWWVQGHVRRINDRQSGTRPVWVKGYPKGDRSAGFIGRREVRRADR